MPTCRWVVNSALRKCGVLAAGREPRLADQTDALEALRGLYQGWIASGAFGRLQDVVPTGTNYVAHGHERIFRTEPDILSVTLPTLVSDGWISDYGYGDRRWRTGYYGTIITIETVSGDTTVTVETGQPIGAATTPRDGAPVIISDQIGGMTAAWLYDGTTKMWEAINNLDEDNDAPRSQSDPEGLAACLAMEIAADYGSDLSAATVMQARRYMQALTHRYGMRRETGVSAYF